MRHKPLLIIMVMILLLPAVLAQPPFQESTPEAGELTVIVPKVEYVLEGAAFDFHVHAYNSTGHQVFNTTTDCKIHVYNVTGNHIIDSVMDWSASNEGWEVTLNTTTTGNKGLLPFIVWCNNTAEGGFFSGTLDINDVTSVGVTDDATQGVSVTFFMLLATLIILLLPKLYGAFTENQIVNLIITRCCYVLGFYLMIMNAGALASIAESAGYATGELFRYLWLFGWGGYILMFVTGIKTLFDITELYKKLVNERRGLE